MERTFVEPCNAYYKIFSDKKDPSYKYRFLSPFEYNNILIKLAVKKSGNISKILDCGRGTPNFYSTIPRYAYGILIQISTAIGQEDCQLHGLGFTPLEKGISKRFNKYLSKVRNTSEGKFLEKAIKKMKLITGFSYDKFIHNIVISTIGCMYPDPPRIQNFVEPVLSKYLDKIIYKPKKSFKDKIKIFPTEGANAAIMYIFNSLKYNGLLVPGDTIAILTPIYSPYLELPGLQNYNLQQVCISSDQQNNWEISDEQLHKISDPKIKALLLVNPTNPTSLSLSLTTTRKIRAIVNEYNPNLIIITDNVYASYVEKFNNLIDVLPYNTIGIYSMSKYFGTTGLRLGLIFIHNHNVIDSKLLKIDDPQNNTRYSMITTTPNKLKFIDRLLIDSRQVAMAHTAGLSTQQQTMMTLFAMYDYLDYDRKYNHNVKILLKQRLYTLLSPLEYQPYNSLLSTNYYIVIDIIHLVTSLYNIDFSDYLYNHRDPLEFVFKLASNYATIVLPVINFAGPFWSIRICLANLQTSSYELIGKNIKTLISIYHEEFLKYIIRSKKLKYKEKKKSKK
jgi:aspartate 4-decarboxylase